MSIDLGRTKIPSKTEAVFSGECGKKIPFA
jgi:hypothetical protein